MSATISAYGKYRYWLSRDGDASLRHPLYVKSDQPIIPWNGY